MNKKGKNTPPNWSGPGGILSSRRPHDATVSCLSKSQWSKTLHSSFLLTLHSSKYFLMSRLQSNMSHRGFWNLSQVRVSGRECPCRAAEWGPLCLWCPPPELSADLGSAELKLSRELGTLSHTLPNIPRSPEDKDKGCLITKEQHSSNDLQHQESTCAVCEAGPAGCAERFEVFSPHVRCIFSNPD